MERSFRITKVKRLGLYLDFPPEGGGAFQYAQSVLDAMLSLPPSEYEIVVAHAHAAWQNILSTHIQRVRSISVRKNLFDNCTWLMLRLGFPLRFWQIFAVHFYPLTRALLVEQCDVWIFPAQDYLTYALPAHTIGTIHDLMHLHEPSFPEVSRWGLRKRREYHYKNMSKYADAILVDSIIGKNHVIDAYDVAPERIHVLPFVAPSYIRCNDPRDFQKRYTLPDKFFFYPAQFWKHKNHVRLLEALASSRELIPDIHLVLAGSKKNSFSTVIRTIERLGLNDRVHLLGYVPDADMPALYRRAIALIMPTCFGPTNIPPLEAMAIGCPMGVSDIYAMAEQVGDAAILFDPTSTTQISQTLVKLATDKQLCKRLSAAGKQRDAVWSQKQFNARFSDIIHSVLTQA